MSACNPSVVSAFRREGRNTVLGIAKSLYVRQTGHVLLAIFSRQLPLSGSPLDEVGLAEALQPRIQSENNCYYYFRDKSKQRGTVRQKTKYLQ